MLHTLLERGSAKGDLVLSTDIARHIRTAIGDVDDAGDEVTKYA